MLKTVIHCIEDNQRLDVFLSANIPDLSRSAAQKLINDGKVSCHIAGEGLAPSVVKTNSAALQKNHRTSIGEIYTVIQNEPESPIAIPQEIPLNVVYEDCDIIVVNKPKGMVVHPAPGHPDGTLVNALLAHCEGSLSGIGGVKRPGIVHRIDKETSGLVIAAKNDAAHISLANQLGSRTLARVYDTIVCGRVKNDTGTINAPIGRSVSDRKRQSVTDKNSRPAITHYEVVERYIPISQNIYGGSQRKYYSHLKCRLETGRTHQIRVHMAHLNHPILGDIVYGHKKSELGMVSQCLHASKLCFTHPATSKKMELTTPLPEYFTKVLSLLISV